GRQRFPQRLEQITVADATAEKHRIGARQIAERGGRLTRYDAQIGYAECDRILGDEGTALAGALDGNRMAAPCRAHPFDGDGATASANVPEQLSRQRRQRRNRRRADLALRQLTIVDEYL